MPNKITPPKSNVPIGRVSANGVDVEQHPEFIRYFFDLLKRVGGTTAQTITDITISVVNIVTAMLTATYDDAHDHRVLSIRSSNGADLAIDELLCWDINYWLTREEILDSRRQNGPTLNLTTQIQFAIDSLVAKFDGPPNPATKSASKAGTLRLHHSYLVDGLDWHPAVRIKGDNFRDTILVQSDTPNGHLLRGLARDGQITGARSPYAQISDIQLLGSNELGPGNMVTRGVWLEDSDQDPVQGPSGEVLGHNASIMERVSISNFSGAGFYCPKKRHGPKTRFCYIQGCGKQLQVDGIATLDTTGQYEPNVYDNSDSDAEYLHNGCGGGGGDSYFIQNGETCQFDGGDCWASANPELGYFAIRATGMDYMLIQGMDINGKVYIKGNGTATPAVTSQVRILGNNFRFRKSSFGNDDEGLPAPLDSYVEIEDAPGVTFEGNTYTPYYAPHTGLVTARPSFVYKTTGASIVVTYDRFPALTDNAWPAGAVIGPTPAIGTISNGLGTKVIMCSGYMDTAVGFSLLTQDMQFAPGGGIFGRVDGTSVPANRIGETITVPLNTVVPLTTATPADIGSGALTQGVWHVYGTQQFQAAAATVTGIRGAITVNTGTIPATSSVNYRRKALNLAGVSFDFDGFSFGPIPITVPAATTVTIYSTVRADFSAGTVGAWGDMRAVRVG
jgi:hypothetical protein